MTRSDRIFVAKFFDAERPDYVILADGTVGGNLTNSTYPADFIRDNLQIQTNFIESARQAGVRKLLGTSRATALGWQPSISLRDGIAATYAWYRDTH